MDIKTIHQVFREEKANLCISLRHVIKPYSGALRMKGSQFIGSDDVLQVMVVRGKIHLFCNQEKTLSLTDREGRFMLRHELCHILDFLEEKIGHDFHGIAESSDILPEALLMNAVISETQKVYFEFLMAKRYIELFGSDEFKEQNEIGMGEFIALCKNVLAEHGRQRHRFSAYNVFIAIFGSLKEMVKVNFYNPRDHRFAGGTWQLIEWLAEDFEFIEPLPVKWRERSSLLCFEALAIFENIELGSALSHPLCRAKRDGFTQTTYTRLNTPSSFSEELARRWSQRINSLAES